MGVPRILHYPGSKWSMAEWIISHMPPHTTYMEPFLGSGAVFFNKPPSALETINDLDGDVVNLFRVIRDRPEELAHQVRWTPYSREEYYESYEPAADEVEQARRFLVRCWMARGTKTSDRTGWSNTIDGTQKNPATPWSNIWKVVNDVSIRLKNVQLENQEAETLIPRYNRPYVLIYADPPYMRSTRSQRFYKHEMTKIEEHKKLLDVLDQHSGPVLLSGYAHEMYDSRLKHWKRETKVVQAEAGKVRTEVLWINPIAAESIGRQLTLF